MAGWEFWIDRGGTFTDVLARDPDGALRSLKLPSVSPSYPDPVLEGIRRVLGDPIPVDRISEVRIGTTIGTNALLQRRGAPTVLAITEGFRDQLRIGYQNRPKLFALQIELPEMLYREVVEVPERVLATGVVERALDEERTFRRLVGAREAGCEACAVVLMHAYRYQDHERRVAELARRAGFEHVVASHESSPVMRLVSRGDTTVLDATLEPLLRDMVGRLAEALPGVRLRFMQSNGGLVDAAAFRGKDSVLSGPAGGAVASARTAEELGETHVVSFDMGGTSTDVSHWAGQLERSTETPVSGIRLRVPMLRVHTIAAGGGSICAWRHGRAYVGPDSAGADPGPACYGRGGPLTLTDVHMALGRLDPSYFPPVFGPDSNRLPDASLSRSALDEFAALAGLDPAQAGELLLVEATEAMAQAMLRVSVHEGHDLRKCALQAFGGAAGQMACRLADRLGIERVLVHARSSLLSALGIGLAELRAVREEAWVGDPAGARARSAALARSLAESLRVQGAGSVSVRFGLNLRLAGSNLALPVEDADESEMESAFVRRFRETFGYEPVGQVEVESVWAEAEEARRAVDSGADGEAAPSDVGERVWRRESLSPGEVVEGPATVRDDFATVLVEPGWVAESLPGGHLRLRRVRPKSGPSVHTRGIDPTLLSIFQHRLMSIAEQMGVVLERTARSVNIKERLDFSCAVFDRDGNLVANAPHMPVHLGSMGESVRAVISARRDTMAQGDAFLLNDPFAGGTHLPDLTVVSPVFVGGRVAPSFYVASRGHHADIGGITPGSMPAQSRCIEEEGIRFTDFPLVLRGAFQEDALRAALGSACHPARNAGQNVADLRAQLGADAAGTRALEAMVEEFGHDLCMDYLGYVQDQDESMVRSLLRSMPDGSGEVETDDGAKIVVAVRVDRERGEATIDFTGTSPQLPTNFNAPEAVTRAAVMYVFRSLIGADTPLNDGCLRPFRLVIPRGSMLSPRPPAAVVAGNVETSQLVTDALFAAVGAMAHSQGTMNNLTFGNEVVQYYETLCGGQGAGPGFEGVGPIHTHMTNSRLTDPEVLEARLPVVLEEFSARTGSGGSGRWRGGDGCVRRLRFLAPVTLSLLSGRRLVAPQGLAGGGPGAPGEARVIRTSGLSENLNGCALVHLEPGDIFVVATPGGGGYGVAS